MALPETAFTELNKNNHYCSCEGYSYLRIKGGQIEQYHYLSFEKALDSILLFNENGRIALAGRNVKKKDLSFPESSRVLPLQTILPKDIYIRLSERVSCHRIKGRNFFSITFFSNLKDLRSDLAKKKLAGRSKQKGQLFFLAFIAILIILVFIPFVVLREGFFGVYLPYLICIILYYALRKFSIFELEWFYLTREQVALFQNFWAPILLFSYLFFVRKFVGVKSTSSTLGWWLRIAEWATIALLLIPALVLVLVGSYWSKVVSTYGLWSVVFLAIPVVYNVAIRKDRPSRIIAIGVAVLSIGLLLIQVDAALSYVTDQQIRIEIESLSFFQIGVLGELIIYWIGLFIRLYEKYGGKQLSFREVRRIRSRLSLLELQLQQLPEEDTISLSTNRRQYKWARTQVQRFEAKRDVTRIYLTDGVQRTLPIGIGEVARQLPDDFLRVHRSHMVRSGAIESYLGGRRQELILKGGAIVPVGRKYQGEVRQVFGT